MPLIKGEPVKVTGRMTVTRITSGGQTDRIHFEIVDDSSGCFLAEAEMDLESFAYLITGHSHMRCQVKAYMDAPIGKFQHLKTEVVTIHRDSLRDPAAVEAAVAPFEVDGWVADRNGVGNSHLSCPVPKTAPAGFAAYRVTFRSFRDEPQPKIEEPRDDVNTSIGNRRKRKR